MGKKKSKEISTPLSISLENKAASADPNSLAPKHSDTSSPAELPTKPASNKLPTSSDKISVTREFLENVFNRGFEKGRQEGYKQGWADKQEQSDFSEVVVGDTHELGAVNGLLWGLNCPPSFRQYWEKTGKLRRSDIPEAICMVCSDNDFRLNPLIYNKVEENATRYRDLWTTSSSAPKLALEETQPSLDADPLIAMFDMDVSSALDSADPKETLAQPPAQEPPSLKWSDEPVGPLPPLLKPRDFSALRSTDSLSSSPWKSLQRRKRRPLRSRSLRSRSDHTCNLRDLHITMSWTHVRHSDLAQHNNGSWVFIPSGLCSVIVQGDEDAAMFLRGAPGVGAPPPM
jgi:hypothetical protein